MKLRVIFFTILFASNCYAEIKKFHNEYENIIPGRSTLEDVINNLGAPKSKIANSNNVKYIFEKVEVIIQDENGIVNTIIITNDTKFIDKNGISIGDTKEMVENSLHVISGEDELIVDMHHGYVYWFYKERVDKIVLTHKMVSR